MKKQSRRSRKTPFSSTAGHTLRSQRRTLDINVETAAQDTHLSASFIRNLERGAYGKLSHDVYTIGFIRRYAEYLRLDPEVAEKKYRLERGPLDADQQGVKKLKRRRTIVTSKLVVVALAGLAAAGVLAYVIWQLVVLTSPPRLEVTAPASDVVVDEPGVTLTGHTDPGATVRVNGVEVFVDDGGMFTTRITLHEGLNRVDITATSKQDKTSSVTRNIVFQVEDGSP